MKLSRSSALVLFLAAGLLPTGCKPGAGPDPEAEVHRLTTELTATQAKLSAAEKRLAAQQEQFASAASVAEAAQKQAADLQATNLERDAKLRAAQKEIADLRKGEAQAFAEASATLQKGVTSTTVSHYQQFVRDFPKSPLVLDANRALAELTETAKREAQWRQSIIDPKRPEREALQHFNDGTAGLDEIVPLMKQKTREEVVTMLGKPNRTYRNGVEIGYVDKVTDPKTGEKGTLIIAFQNERVLSVRVGYQGREIRP